MTEQARDWKYANPGYPNVTRDQLRVMNLMMHHDRCGVWTEQRMANLEESLRQADEFIESIGWDVDFEAFKAQGEQGAEIGN